MQIDLDEQEHRLNSEIGEIKQEYKFKRKNIVKKWLTLASFFSAYVTYQNLVNESF